MDQRSDCATVCAEMGLEHERACCMPCHVEAEPGNEYGVLEPLLQRNLHDGRGVLICCGVEGALIDRGLLGE